MNLLITTSVNLSIGGSTYQNIYGTITQYAKDNVATGGLTVPCTLKWWVNEAASEADKDMVWPLKSSGAKIDATEVELSAAEAAAAGLPYTIYLKVAEKLMQQNPGMTVTVQAP